MTVAASVPWSSDVKASVRIGDVHDLIPVDKDITSLNYLSATGARVHQAARRWRHQCSDFFRLVSVRDVKYPHPGF
jgi:hypothetical protein